MAKEKSVKKVKSASAGAASKKAAPAPAAAEKRPKVVAPPPAREARPVPPSKPAGPTARTCPLVMDGELDAADFSPSDCLTCSEFDCRFCEAEEGSGTLRSRLFAGEDDGDEAEDAWGGDFGIEGGEESDEGVEGEDEEGF